MKSYIELRVSDNVLDADQWGIVRATVVDGYILALERTMVGMYTIPAQIEWSLRDLAEWLSYDPTGDHPESYHEIRAWPTASTKYGQWQSFAGCKQDKIVMELKRLLEASAV